MSGIELTTFRLSVWRSTNWANRPIADVVIFSKSIKNISLQIVKKFLSITEVISFLM